MSPLLVAYLCSSCLSLLIARSCWGRHEVLGAHEYAVVALSQALWTLGYCFELVSTSLEGKIFWDNAQFIAGAGWIAGFLAFTLRYTDRRMPRPAISIPLLSAPLVALVVLAYTDPLHGLIRANVRLVPGQPYDALLYDVTGPVWALAIYAYGAYLGGILMLLLNPARSNPLYQSQIGLLVIGSLVPILGSVLTISLLAESPARDISPFTFAISSTFIALALFRYRLFALVPIARDVVIESLADAVFVLDARGQLVDLNPAARLLMDGSALTLDRLGIDAMPVRWGKPIADPFAETCCRVQERELLTATGVRQVELRFQRVFNRRGVQRGFVAVIRDITERKAVEAELAIYREQLEALVEARTADLRQTNTRLEQEITRRERLEAQVISGQKLEALGRMASGIAHDFNNVLTVVQGTVDLLIERRGPADPDMRDFTAITKATQQAATLTRQLLAFSRGQSLQLRAVDLATIVADSAEILQRLAGPRVQLRLDLHQGATTVMADVSQLQQVLVNLVVNARDAMPDGGELLLRVCRTARSAAGHSAGPAAQQIRITVSDTGVGMDELTRQHLFEPFFTTKEPGRGTGLGLSVVYGIVVQFGGTIKVESAPGRGATFIIDLPPANHS